jgi:predicted permease
VVTPLTDAVVGKARRGLLILLGAIASVLLIACSNLANLSLTRAVGRVRDSAIRAALGAGRGRLIAHTVVEQLVVSATGGILGIAVAYAALKGFVRTAPLDLPRVSDVSLDGQVLAFSAGVSIFAGVLVAILPAVRTARADVEQTLRAAALSISADRGGMRTRDALLALQVALSLTLLIVTGLLVTSFMRLMNVDRGFVTERVLAVPISLPAVRYGQPTAALSIYNRLLEAVHALPGVQSATTFSSMPLAGSGQVNGISPEGGTTPRGEQLTANFRFVAPEFFRTLDIRVLRGRAFSEADRAPERTMPALLSEPTAKRLWPDQDAIGKRFSRGIPGEAGFEVVGVVADARLTSLDRTPPLMVYVPYWWQSRTSMALLIKTAGEPAALMPAVRRVVSQLDPEIAIGNARSLDRVVEESVAARRYQMQLFVAFGVVALFIATLGVYGVTSYGVLRRRRELNIRTALGARTGQVLALMIRQVMTPIVFGIAAGTAGALAIGGIVATLLFDVRPRDPLLITSVVAVIGAVGLITCLVATKRGLALDPAAALREE